MDIALTIVASIMLLVGFLIVCRSSLGDDEEEYEDEEEDEEGHQNEKSET